MRVGAPGQAGRARGLGLAQRQAARVERLPHLLDRLRPEVRDSRELRLGALEQLADGLDAGALEAVVGPDAELELLDQDLVHYVGATGVAGVVDLAGELAVDLG